MLSLSVQEGEYIMIGDDIKVCLMRTTGPKGKQLSVGIEAPSDVVIQRYKIYEENLLKLAEEGDTDAYDKAAQLIQERQARSQKRLRAQAKLKQRQAAKAV